MSSGDFRILCCMDKRVLITIVTIAVLSSCGSSQSGETSRTDQSDSTTTTANATDSRDNRESATDAAQAGEAGGGYAGRDGAGGEFLAAALSDAAEALEVSVEALVKALGTSPDIEAASEKLEIPVQVLQGVLPEFLSSERGSGGPGEGGFGGGLAVVLGEAAEKLEVTVEALVDALGRPIDLESAAEKLELTVEQITAALPEQFSQGNGRGGGRGGFGSADTP